MRSAGCFLFSLLSMFIVLYVSAASRFGCVAILDLYFSEYLLISSLTVGIPRSLRMSSFLMYQGPFTIVLRILACITSILFIWLIAAVPHNGIPYVQIGFMIVLYIFNLFSTYQGAFIKDLTVRQDDSQMFTQPYCIPSIVLRTHHKSWHFHS